MNRYTGKNLSLISSEKRSAKLLMEKMGLSKRELVEISGKYGVSAAQLLERMQLSKYRFIQQEPEKSHCAPCNPSVSKFYGNSVY
jgi:hypothetical protein